MGLAVLVAIRMFWEFKRNRRIANTGGGGHVVVPDYGNHLPVQSAKRFDSVALLEALGFEKLKSDEVPVDGVTVIALQHGVNILMWNPDAQAVKYIPRVVKYETVDPS